MKFQGPNQPVFKIFASIKTFQFLNYLKRGQPFEFILERLNKVSKKFQMNEVLFYQTYHVYRDIMTLCSKNKTI